MCRNIKTDQYIVDIEVNVKATNEANRSTKLNAKVT